MTIDYLNMQIASVEVPEEYMGSVVELLGKRRGQMFDMQGVGSVVLFFLNSKQNANVLLLSIVIC